MLQLVYAWVGKAAHIRGEEGAPTAAAARQQLGGLLGAMKRGANSAGALAWGVRHFIKVTRSYWPGLFSGYDVAGLPRTNNDLEQFFGRHRYHERRCSGRKAASPALVLRGEARLLAAAATRQGYSEFEGRSLSKSRAWSGWAAISRVAAATLGAALAFNRWMATFRSDARTRAAAPRRTRQRSSRKVSSRVWCNPFSIPQWARLHPNSRSAVARPRLRLVIP